MKRLFFFMIIILSMSMTIGGCGGKSQNGGIEPPHEVKVDTLQEQIQQMTLDEKIGQLVMVGFDGYEVNPHVLEMIEKYKIGGFIFFSRNIKNVIQTLALIDSLKEANKENKFPLFFAVDEEGGSVSRMPKEFERLPTARAIGETNNEDLAFQTGNTIGTQLKSLGFNLNFAPVLDIDSNPQNPVIGDRSFGKDEEVVSRIGIATMKGMGTWVIPCVKHFPGHGDTSVDSHKGLPVVEHDLDRLKSFELVPFAKAIDNGAEMIMVAHILLPEIDTQNPATFSKKVITTLLREDMRFDGVVITDDMTMGAIVESYDIGDGAIKSIMAGTDIVLVCHGYDKQVMVLKALRNAVESGDISRENLDKHVYRILKLKQILSTTDGF